MDPALEDVIEQYQRTIEAVLQGDPLPQEDLWSRRDDVTLANPLGPPARGWTEVSNALRRAVSQLSDGEVLGSERISGYSNGDLAYILEIERFRVKVGGACEPAPSSLRVTTIFRREDDGWKILHRHADPISEYSGDDLAYTVEIERTRAKLGGGPEPATVSLRVTTIFRREEDGWKIVHRHADPITTPRPAESMVDA